MDYTKFTQADAAGTMESLVLDEKLYWVSSLVDVLRDNAKDLLELTASGRAANTRLTGELVARYARLRDEAAGLLNDEDATRLRAWTRDLGAEVSDDEVFEASGNLARCLDVILQTPLFIASRVNQRSEIHTVLTRNGLADATVAVPPTKEPVGGQYL